mgnify:CR=1 FL=1
MVRILTRQCVHLPTLREAGIQTHMLDRGLNALRMYPVPADVRRLMYRVKHAQGVDITRIFCGFE